MAMGKVGTTTHGTAAGYHWHRRNGDEACAPCKAASNAYSAQKRARQRERRLAGRGIRDLTHRGPDIVSVDSEQRAIFNDLHLGDRVRLVSAVYRDTPIRRGEEGLVVKRGWTGGGYFADVLWDRGVLFYVSPDAGDRIERVAA